MRFVRKNLPAIIVFISMGVASWFAGDYFLSEDLKIGRRAIPMMIWLTVVTIFIVIRVRYKKWILNREDWEDFTGNIK